MLVAVLRAVILASTITASDASLTSPVRLAVLTWASEKPAESTNAQIAVATECFDMTDPFKRGMLRQRCLPVVILAGLY